MNHGPYRDTIPREAPGCVCPPVAPAPNPPTSRRRIDLDRVAIWMMWTGSLAFTADLMIIVGLAMSDGAHPVKGNPPPWLFVALIPCFILATAGLVTWLLAPQDDGVPSEAEPRPPRNWARVGAFLTLGGLLGYAADLISAWTLRAAVTSNLPGPCRWIAMLCFVAMAIGSTLAVCAEGKAWPGLS